MNRVSWPLLFGFGLIASCEGDKPKSMTRDEALAADTIATEPCELELSTENDGLPPVVQDEDFNSFFFRYATDGRLQKSRTNFPLHLNAFGSDLAIERDEWQQQTFFSDPDFYTVFLSDKEEIDLMETSNRAAVDVQLINAEDSTMRTFHFDRQDGKWKLTREVLDDLANHDMADFYFFYHTFVTDSTFQQQSIARSLQYVTTDPEDESQSMEGTLTPDQWFAFSPDMPRGLLTNIMYGQMLHNPSHVVMLKCGFSNGMMDIFTFRRTGGEWKLIAYEN